MVEVLLVVTVGNQHDTVEIEEVGHNRLNTTEVRWEGDGRQIKIVVRELVVLGSSLL
ncbi:unknown (plasmid) [Haloarcula marismortui ATCC 43049]|uniref:Uncharacterized protein n=1 Tax=Haloarcula marismortui (strain ATCC 43049 / DSM 3752 / JCM 8966 / VKM B-1809) TaxID=272569 RepID=Q5V603_HALMA|nr:unknown [Haloarcula marismortui ATCC 43049]